MQKQQADKHITFNAKVDKTIKVKKEIKVRYQTLETLLASAFEGGSNYWYDHIEPLADNSMHRSESNRFYENVITNGFKLKDKTTNKTITIKPHKFIKAFAIMVEKQNRHWQSVATENTDATTGDVFLQLCCFGEVLYG